MPDDNRKPEPSRSDSSEIEKLLEIELMQKRMAWQQAKVRRGNLRALSFLFLFFVIAGALFVYFVLLTPRMHEGRPETPEPGSPAPVSSTPAG